MIGTVRNAWKIPELRNKILFTIFAVLIFRLGATIPVPFIDRSLLEGTINSAGTIFELLNTMSGSAFSQATIFALSIQPYINASIIIQLLTIAIPALERLSKEGGEEGKKKIQSITRYTTLAIGALQGFGYYMLLRSYDLLTGTGFASGAVIVLTFTAGSVFLMWLGEQITEFGIGNGISIILFTGIISRVPSLVMSIYNGVTVFFATRDWEAEALAEIAQGIMHPAIALLLIVGMLLLVIFIVFISNSERKIPVQYAKRVVGRKVYGGQASHIPMKLNMAGVLPIIFAQTIASLPATIGMFVPASQVEGTGWHTFLSFFDTSSFLYALIYFLLIIAFSYFYTSIQFNPVEVANNLKRNGGFIPGFRPGKPTADFLAKVLSRLTMFGALYLGVIAILPIITGGLSGYAAMSIGGTSVIIVVGVALDTVKQLEAQMLMRHYKGFLE